MADKPEPYPYGIAILNREGHFVLRRLISATRRAIKLSKAGKPMDIFERDEMRRAIRDVKKELPAWVLEKAPRSSKRGEK